MINLVVFLLLMSLAETQGSDSRSEISERMHYFLTKLCPQSAICNGNVSSNVDKKNNSAYRSCCADCSCAPNCGDTGDCCFVNGNRTLLNKTDVNLKSKEDVSRQCLYPVTGKPEGTDFKYFRSYYMASSLLDKDTLDQFEACGSKNVGPWGSLHPLFSKQTNTIYKNKCCAEIDNITDGEYRDTILRCRSYNPETLIAHLANGSMPKECRIQFIYPGNFNDIKPHLCYRDMIDSCTRTQFKVPVVLDATKDEIIEDCQGGLVSPYFGDQYSLYANVFCRICSRNYFNENTLCTNFQTEKELPGSSDDYIGLLDINVLSTNDDASTTDALSNPNSFTVCPKNTKDKTFHCRPLLCPSGQMRNSKGMCVFPVQRWYQQNIGVILELKCEQEFETTKAFEWSKGLNYVSDIKNLSLPSLVRFNEWTVLFADYIASNSSNDTSTTCLIVFLSRFFQSANPVHITQNISLLMSEDWFLNYDTESLILKPSLFQMKYPYNAPYFSHFEINESLTIKRPSFKTFYALSVGRTPKNSILITKLHICEQRELDSSEYYLSRDRIVLYNKITQQYIFNSEFVEVLDISDGKVRICLDGSGFVKSNVAKCGGIASGPAAVAVFVAFSALEVIFAGAHAE